MIWPFGRRHHQVAPPADDVRRELVILEKEWKILDQFLPREDGHENACVLLCGVTKTPSLLRFIVKYVAIPEEPDFLRRGPAIVSLSDDFMRRVLRDCIEKQLHLVRVHTHPFSTRPSFSSIDDRADIEGWFPYVARKIAGIEHASVIFGQNLTQPEGRVWDREHDRARPLDIVKAILPDRLGIYPTTSSRRANGSEDGGTGALARTASDQPGSVDDADRTSLAFGPEAKRKFRRLRVAVVGAGGLGSIAAELLARLPVARIVLIDPDKVETTNLNRLQGVGPADVGRFKVDSIADYLSRIAPDLEVIAVRESLFETEGEIAAAECDLILGCVDSVRARFAMNELALQHAIAYFDLGTAARAEHGTLVEAGGQVLFMRPGQGWCLSCREIFSKRQAAIEALSRDERHRDEQLGYLPEAGPAPSVYGLNMSVAAAGIVALMRYASGGFQPSALLRVDAFHQRMESILIRPSETPCLLCGAAGALGTGRDFCEPPNTSVPDEVPEVPKKSASVSVEPLPPHGLNAAF